MLFVPIHTFNETFALGVFETEKEAQDAYKLYIKSHANYEKLVEDYFEEFSDKNLDLDKLFNSSTMEEDIFFEDHEIGCTIYDVKPGTFNFILEFGGWLSEINGVNHLESLMRAIITDSYLHREFQLDVKQFAQDHPVL